MPDRSTFFFFLSQCSIVTSESVDGWTTFIHLNLYFCLSFALSAVISKGRLLNRLKFLPQFSNLFGLLRIHGTLSSTILHQGFRGLICGFDASISGDIRPQLLKSIRSLCPDQQSALDPILNWWTKRNSWPLNHSFSDACWLGFCSHIDGKY